MTPYVCQIPSVVAKASAMWNPIVYAVSHPKYRRALQARVPFCKVLFKVSKSTSGDPQNPTKEVSSHSTGSNSQAGYLTNVVVGTDNQQEPEVDIPVSDPQTNHLESIKLDDLKKCTAGGLNNATCDNANVDSQTV